MSEKKRLRRLTKALLEIAAEMRKAGVLGKATHDKIKMRHLAPKVAQQ